MPHGYDSVVILNQLIVLLYHFHSVVRFIRLLRKTHSTATILLTENRQALQMITSRVKILID